jgi:hypothetical protein
MTTTHLTRTLCNSDINFVFEVVVEVPGMVKGGDILQVPGLADVWLPDGLCVLAMNIKTIFLCIEDCEWRWFNDINL